jgi:hypothetical protein
MTLRVWCLYSYLVHDPPHGKRKRKKDDVMLLSMLSELVPVPKHREEKGSERKREREVLLR